MKKHSNTLAFLAAIAVGATATVAAAAPILFEESIAREEEGRIINAPIAGIANNLWFDYRIDVVEAQKELKSDLRRASDIEDQRDAWSEYATELKHERKDYIKDMAKRGYRYRVVTVEPQ